MVNGHVWKLHVIKMFSVLAAFTFSVICDSLRPRCETRRRSVVTANALFFFPFFSFLFPLYHLFSVRASSPCNTNTNGEYGGWRSSSKPEFWIAASAWADLWSDALSWLQVTSVFSWTERSHGKTTFSDDEDVICTACGWLEYQEQQFSHRSLTVSSVASNRWIQDIKLIAQFLRPV